MHLDEYVSKEGRGTLERLRKATGLAYTTIFNAAKRRPVKTYATALRIAQATHGAVSIDELCAPAAQSAMTTVAQ